MYYYHPCKIILSSLIILLACTGVAFSQGYFNIVGTRDRDMLVWTDDRVQAWDQLIVAEEYLQDGGGGEERPLRLTSVMEVNPVLVYKHKQQENLLLKENLLKILNIENNIKEFDDWTNICLAKDQDNLECSDDAY